MDRDLSREAALRAVADLGEKAARAKDILDMGGRNPGATGGMAGTLALLEHTLTTSPCIAVVLAEGADSLLEGRYAGFYAGACADMSREMSLLDDALSQVRSQARVAANVLDDIRGLADEALGY